MWVYTADKLSLVGGTPFKSISQAANHIKVTNSTVKDVLDKEIAISKGYYCFSSPISSEVRQNLLRDIRDKISSIRKMVWVYDENIEIINGSPFISQQEMLRSLGLNQVRTVNKYKDTGLIYKGYYFYSQEMSISEKERVRNDKNYANINTKSKQIWVYDANNQLVNGKPFLSIIKCANSLELNRKTISKVIDKDKVYGGYKFNSYKIK